MTQKSDKVIIEETKEYLSECAKFQPEYFQNLVPYHRIDTEEMWYIVFYNTEQGGFELHWFRGDDHDMSPNVVMSKLEEMYNVPNSRYALRLAIGRIQINEVMNNTEPVKITRYTSLL